MVHTHGMQTHFDVCLMKHNQQGKSEAETSQCLPKPTAIMLGQLVILILHISALLLAYVMESNVLAFTGKGDAVHSRPVGHWSFPGIKDRHSAGLWGNKTIRSSGTWSKWSFYSCKEDGICLTNYNTRYKWFKYYMSNKYRHLCKSWFGVELITDFGAKVATEFDLERQQNWKWGKQREDCEQRNSWKNAAWAQRIQFDEGVYQDFFF